MQRRFLSLFGFLTFGLALVSGEAHAGKYDLDLTPLGEQTANGIQQDDAAFRSLSSQLGVIMAPQPMDPADSLGLSGFALSVDMSVNTIAEAEPYWDLTADGANTVAPSLQVVGRKGLWPGFEVGGGATHMFDSRMWAMSGYGKFAFHEGFHHLPIPSISVRASFSRLLGAKDLNMTTAAPAVTISHVFGLGKTFSLTPYAGYEALLIISRSTVLDATPNCDEFADAYNEMACANLNASVPSEFVFQNAGTIVRHRPFFGARMIFSVIRIGFEAMFVPKGSTEGELEGIAVKDNAAFQQQYTFSLGLDF
ncbi:MAG: hypothetical protein JKY37_02945 [Nannocystaceae bacterium]|nr:hypothetical protein [Nannocystaceae bacterium]